jgi:hypothetical protein
MPYDIIYIMALSLNIWIFINYYIRCIILRFPSLKSYSTSQLLDYHEFIIVKPKTLMTTSLITSPIANSATSESPLTRLLVIGPQFQ